MRKKIFTALIGSMIVFPGTAYQASDMEQTAESLRREAREQVQVERKQGADTFLLQNVTVNSDLPIKQPQLQHIINPYLGTNVGIRELREIANEIKVYCRQEGYLAAVAYIPEQNASGGNVQINLISATFGKVIMHNESHLANDILENVAKNIEASQYVEDVRIEDLLYRVNAIGGVMARGELVPDATSKKIDLHIHVKDDQKNRGILYTENYGNKNTGRYRFGLLYDMFNIDNRGSKLEVTGLISTKDLNNFVIDYSIITDRQATSRAGISFGRTSYYVSGPMSYLGNGGDSYDFRIYGSTPIFKSVKYGLDWTYDYKFRNIKDHIKLINYNGKKYLSVASTGLSGYLRKHNSIFNYGVKVYGGHVSGRNELTNLLYGRIMGDFARGEVTLDYRKNLGKYWEGHTNMLWQEASKNLNGSEQIQLGGAHGVRGYADSEGSGDKGYLSKTEFIWHPKVSGLTFNLFFDIGGSGLKSDDIHTIRSWGLGTAYAKPNDYFIKVDYARKIGNNKAVTLDSTRQRWWFMAGKIF